MDRGAGMSDTSQSPPGFDPLGVTIDGKSDTQRDGAPAGMPFSGPRQIGRFLLLRELGAGGMGTVYAAYDEKLDRRVAIKLLHGSQAQSEKHHQQTLREAQAMARVAHPNVIAVYEVGECEGRVFIAMEFVDGTTLTSWQAARGHTAILPMYLQAGEGLRAAHQMGLVHRGRKLKNPRRENQENRRCGTAAEQTWITVYFRTAAMRSRSTLSAYAS